MADVIRLESTTGQVRVDLLAVGATIQKLFLPDRNGTIQDVVLGCDDLEFYRRGETPYFGGIVGRVANRTAHGEFQLQGRTHRVSRNDHGKHCLHGGDIGFNRVAWKGRRVSDCHARFEYHSKDGEEGFPGDVDVCADYELAEDGSSLTITMTGVVAGATTPLNLASHGYFNLGGHDGGAACLLDHELEMPCLHFLPVDNEHIPTGEIRSVESDPAMDFRTAKKIGRDIDAVPGGYDHNFVVSASTDDDRAGTMRLAAVLYHAASGRGMRVYTTAPGVQFYSGNFLEAHPPGKDGAVYTKHSGCCLETQGFPDAVHHAHFPSIIYKPGDEYRHVVKYEFFTSKIR